MNGSIYKNPHGLNLSLSLSLAYQNRKEDSTGLSCCPPRLPKGGQRRGNESYLLSDCTGGDLCG